MRQPLEAAMVTQMQSLSTLAIDAIVKRCTSGETAEPVLELLRSVHGAHFFPKDDLTWTKGSATGGMKMPQRRHT